MMRLSPKVRESVAAQAVARMSMTKAATSPRVTRARTDTAEAFMAALARVNEAVTLCPRCHWQTEEDLWAIIENVSSSLRAHLDLIFVVNRVRSQSDAFCREFKSRAFREAQAVVEYHEIYAREIEREEHVLTVEVAI